MPLENDKGKGKKKYLDKYDDEASLVAAYQELEKKLGEQGTTMGKSKQDLDAALAQIAQYADWAGKANPIIDWYAKNEAAIRQMIGEDGKLRQPASPDGRDKKTPTYDILTADEKEALASFVGDRFKSSVFDPWTTTLEKKISEYATGAQGNLNNLLKAHTDVMWRTMQHMWALPQTMTAEERIKSARTWHEEALKLSDPSKYDPMETAREFLGLRAERDTQKKQIEDLTNKVVELEKKAVPSIGSGPPPSLFARPDAEPPKTKEERMQAAVDAVKTEHGAEGVKQLFPAAV